MKIIKHENGIELVPESEFEKDCLKHVSNGKQIKFIWTDEWNRSGNLKLEFKKDDWGT